MRTCTKCQEPKPTSAFGPDKRNKKDGLARWCRACRQEYVRAYCEQNRGRVQEGHIRRHYQKRYGITPEQYDQMLSEQQGVCAICNSTPESDRNRELQRLAVDHDHDTGEVRGLLCARCNLSLGHIEPHGRGHLLAIDQYLSRKSGWGR